MEVVYLSLVLIIGFYMLWNIGANDVANAIGTSVGSGALTLKRAIIIAALLEFAGAFLLGDNVSETIQKGIVDPSAFADTPMLFVVGMIASLLGTAIWLQVATYLRWPVSTTHAIVGAILGFGLVALGTRGVQWSVVGSIAISWIVSPTIAAICSFFIFGIIQRTILFAFNPVRATKRIAPYLVFVVLFSFMLATLFGGNNNFNVELPFYLVFSIALMTAFLGSIISYFLLSRINDSLQLTQSSGAKQEHQLYCLNKARKHLLRAKLASGKDDSGQLEKMNATLNHLIEDVKSQGDYDSHIGADYRTVESVFGYLQILTACFVAFAHGANDVANAVGPVAAVIQTLKSPFLIGNSTQIPLWLLFFGGFGIITGLATYGWRVIETIGHKITQLTPTRGFSAEFAAAVTILVASKLGMPISTTHAIVGAVLGVGLARGISALNFRLIKGIFLSWIITIPCAALASIALFFFFQFFFL